MAACGFGIRFGAGEAVRAGSSYAEHRIANTDRNAQIKAYLERKLEEFFSGILSFACRKPPSLGP